MQKVIRKKIQRGDLYNPWLDYYKRGIGTLAYNDSWNLFDQIILSPALLNKDQKGFFFREAKNFQQALDDSAKRALQRLSETHV